MPTCPAFHRQVQLGCRRGMAEVHLNSLSCAVGGDGGFLVVAVVFVIVVVVIVVVVVAGAAVAVVQNKCGKCKTCTASEVQV